MHPLTVSLIQSDLHWEDPAANLDMFTQQINNIGQPTQLVILPEMFTTGFSMQPEKFAETMSGPTLQWMKTTAARKKVILTGSLMIEEDGKYYNRLIWMLPNGQCGHYDKRHLFGHGGEDKHYSGGSRKLIGSVNGWRVCLLICYDLRFPVWARNQMLEDEQSPEYDLLIYVANWPEARNHAWKTLLQARAIENQCYVIGVNRIGTDAKGIYHSGDSMLIDPMGAPLFEKAHEGYIHTQTISPEVLHSVRNKLPFLKDGDSFHIDL